MTSIFATKVKKKCAKPGNLHTFEYDFFHKSGLFKKNTMIEYFNEPGREDLYAKLNCLLQKQYGLTVYIVKLVINK